MANVLLINASAAKEGGAKSIVEKYCEEADFQGFSKVYLLAPKNVVVSNNCIKHIPFSTSGFATYLFSILGVVYFIFKLKVTHSISFNNVTVLFPFTKRLIYFHQYLALSQKKLFPLAPFITRHTLTYLTFRAQICVQTTYVKDAYQKIIGCRNDVEVFWPGYERIKSLQLLPNDSCLSLEKRLGFNYVFVPITNILQKHRNFDFFLRNRNYFIENKIMLILPSDQYIDEEFIINVGYLDKANLNYVYDFVDAMIFVSLEETVGLMLYEFSDYLKPIHILERPYLTNSPLMRKRSFLVFLFRDFPDFFSCQVKSSCIITDTLEKGSWPKISTWSSL